MHSRSGRRRGSARQPPSSSSSSTSTFPFLIVAVGLLALAWAERSRALAVAAVVYTGAALLASLYDVSNIIYRLGWNLPPSDESLPNVLLPAAVLLVAGAGAFAVQRRHRATA